MSQAFKGAVAVVLGGVLWGTWKVWMRGPALDPGAQGAFVIGLAGMVATLLALRQRTRWPDIPRWAWGFMAAIGVAEAINCALYFRSISEGDIATGVVTHYLAPVIVAVVSPLVREPMGRRAPWAAGVAFLATAAIVGLGGGGAGTRAAAIEGAGSAVFYAALIFLSKRISGFFKPWEMVGFHDLVAAPLILLTSRTPIHSAGASEILYLILGALFSGTVASGLYFYGMARIPAARVAVLSYAEPVSASLVGVVLLHEPLTTVKGIAMLVVVAAGVAVATERAPAGAVPGREGATSTG